MAKSAAMDTNALDKACQIVGSQNNLAARLGIRCASISGWRRRGKVPTDRCLDIERATDGQVTCFDLRPDKFPAPQVELARAG